MINIRKKEELLTPTSDVELKINESMEIIDILPDEGVAGEYIDGVDCIEEIKFYGTPELQKEIRSLCGEYRHLFSTKLRRNPSKCPPMKLAVQDKNWFKTRIHHANKA
jgi:hypothetical protein